jgi:hypothetical protein
MTKKQKQQDLREALWEASRALREKQSALEKFLPVMPLGEEPPQGYELNELKRVFDEWHEAEEKYRALWEEFCKKQ